MEVLVDEKTQVEVWTLLDEKTLVLMEVLVDEKTPVEVWALIDGKTLVLMELLVKGGARWQSG